MNCTIYEKLSLQSWDMADFFLCAYIILSEQGLYKIICSEFDV